MNTNDPEFSVLLIDDSADWLQLSEIALKKTQERLGIKLKLHKVPTAEKAESFLQETLPNLIISDIKLPGISGLELLSLLKKDDRLRLIPVIILSTSALDSDVKKAYHEYASVYFQKPHRLEELINSFSYVCNVYFKNAKLPPYEKNTFG